MAKEIILPNLGCEFAVVSLWYLHQGEELFNGDRVIEILVRGATFDVSSPASGRLMEKKVHPGDRVFPGQVLGTVDEQESSI